MFEPYRKENHASVASNSKPSTIAAVRRLTHLADTGTSVGTQNILPQLLDPKIRDRGLHVLTLGDHGTTRGALRELGVAVQLSFLSRRALTMLLTDKRS